MMLLMMHQPHLHQPWRLDRCDTFIHTSYRVTMVVHQPHLHRPWRLDRCQSSIYSVSHPCSHRHPLPHAVLRNAIKDAAHPVKISYAMVPSDHMSTA